MPSSQGSSERQLRQGKVVLGGTGVNASDHTSHSCRSPSSFVCSSHCLMPDTPVGARTQL